MVLRNALEGLSTESKQDAILTRLQGILDVAVNGPIALDAASLAALENITATLSGAVALDSATLAALENITVTVSNALALDATTLAALEHLTVSVDNLPVTQQVSGTIGLDVASLAALETITAIISGTVDVSDRVNRSLGVVSVSNQQDLSALGKDTTLQQIRDRADFPDAATVSAIVALVAAVAKDATSSAIAAALSEIAATEQFRREFSPPRELAHIRDTADRLYVNVASGTTVVTTLNLWNGGTYVVPYSTSASIGTVDGRDLLQSLQYAAFMSRRSRWVIT